MQPELSLFFPLDVSSDLIQDAQDATCPNDDEVCCHIEKIIRPPPAVQCSDYTNEGYR